MKDLKLLRQSLAMLLLAVVFSDSQAQFAGGSGDGYSADTTTWNFVYEPVTPLAVYTGGSADGYAADSTIWNFVAEPIVPLAPYTGGDGDGYASDTTVWNFVEVPVVPVALYSGGAGDGYASIYFLWEGGSAPILVRGRVFLEGPYFISTHNHSPSIGYLSAIPNIQPYGQAEYLGTDLYYAGVDSFSVLPDSAVDWIRLSLRSAPSADSTVGSPAVGLVMVDGAIRGADGVSSVLFDSVAFDDYYLVIDHRNHVSVMSAIPVDMNGGQGYWDYTSSISQAYTTGPKPMKNLGDGNFAMYTGDIVADGIVNTSDFNIWLAETKIGLTGYRGTDLNMDGSVTTFDFNLWLVNTKLGAASQVP